MLKTIAGLALGALLCAASLPAYAAGVQPQNGFGMPDGTFINGLAQGQNETYQYGLTASTVGTGTQIPAATALVEFDTVASSGGAVLPYCFQGQEFSLYNNGANTLTVYTSLINNPVTAALDTVNNTTNVSVSSHSAEFFGCAKNGVWSAK